MGKFEKRGPEKKKKSGILKYLPLFLLLAVTIVAVLLFANYHMVSWKLYPKDARILDLREEQIDTATYDKLREKMPDCEIRWNIPFQGGVIAHDAEQITVSALTEGDVVLLDYARELKTVNAEGCTDYDALELLRSRRPEVAVHYSVALHSGDFSWDVAELTLQSIAQEDIQNLKYLPNLKLVTLAPGSYESAAVDALREYTQTEGLAFGVLLGGKVLLSSETAGEISGATEEELALLEHLPMLRELKLINPDASGEVLLALRDRYPQMELHWQVEIAGLSFGDTVTEVDLSMAEITDLSQVEAKLACLPELEQVTFGLCGADDPEWENSKSKLTPSPIENEELAAYRDRVRDDYKVVWTVRLGPGIALRTDVDNFMPAHFNIGRLPDDHAYNLRYCEEMVCLDVGHMYVTDISFVEYMPNLKYLILAWTGVQYIEPIRSCKNLVFLELDNSPIRDISPLVDCTALEDLNVGNTDCDTTPLMEMPWLKNLYMVHRPSAGLVAQAIPETHVVGSDVPTAVTVGYGWRKLPNYYAMRDCLNMPYMDQ